MATNEELSKAFKILCGAGLEYTPSEKELPMRTEAWGELLADVPGDLLIQGVKDIALAGERFPSIKRIRDAAYQVQIHNGTSAAPNPWKPIIAGKQDRGTGVYVITPEG